MLATSAYVALLALLTLPTVADAGPPRRRRSPTKPKPCLCIFDFDRTLTGKQGDTHHCKHNEVYNSIHDPAYGGGPLTLSEGAYNLEKTFCHLCYVGVTSAGHGPVVSSEMGSKIVRHLNWNKKDHLQVSDSWTEPLKDKVKSPLVVGIPAGHKHHVASSIRDWYMNTENIHIEAQRTNFFDDEAKNVQLFKGFDYQARQISCKSRDNTMDDNVGYCGMTLKEIVSSSGIHFCEKEDGAYTLPSTNATAGQVWTNKEILV